MNSFTKSAFVYFVAFVSPALASFPSDPGPAGFEDPALLEKVMDGQIVIQDKVDTKLEFRTVSKAYFNKVSPEAYWALAVDHPRYPKLFTEVKAGKTVGMTDDKNSADWWLHLKIKVGFLTQDVYPEGRQTWYAGLDAASEGRIENDITNFKEHIVSAKQRTRLIPYENGILVEDDVHVVLQPSAQGSALIKKKLKEFFLKYVSAFRTELQGGY